MLHRTLFYLYAVISRRTVISFVVMLGEDPADLCPCRALASVNQKELSLLKFSAIPPYPELAHVLITMPNIQQSNAMDVVSSSASPDNFAALNPSNLLPEHYSRHMHVLTKLKRVCSARSTRPPTGNKHSYTIDLFTPSQSTTRIPAARKTFDLEANEQQKLASRFREPAVRTEKRFTDFVKLRDEIFELCHAETHPFMNCRFCSKVTLYLLEGNVLPGSLLTWVLTRRLRTKAVQRFVESLLLFASSCLMVISKACPCQQEFPDLLHEFLFEESD